MELHQFPALNAALNSTSAFLLLMGYLFIRQGSIKAHTLCMVSACFSSLLFLGCYIYYHFHHGSTPFQGQGVIRWIYFAVLLSHTILAVLIVPLVFKTLTRALKGNFPAHSRMARITFPLWLYVSVTGVVIYWMLYHAYA